MPTTIGKHKTSHANLILHDLQRKAMKLVHTKTATICAKSINILFFIECECLLFVIQSLLKNVKNIVIIDKIKYTIRGVHKTLHLFINIIQYIF